MYTRVHSKEPRYRILFGSQNIIQILFSTASLDEIMMAVSLRETSSQTETQGLPTLSQDQVEKQAKETEKELFMR